MTSERFPGDLTAITEDASIVAKLTKLIKEPHRIFPDESLLFLISLEVKIDKLLKGGGTNMHPLADLSRQANSHLNQNQVQGIKSGLTPRHRRAWNLEQTRINQNSQGSSETPNFDRY